MARMKTDLIRTTNNLMNSVDKIIKDIRLLDAYIEEISKVWFEVNSDTVKADMESLYSLLDKLNFWEVKEAKNKLELFIYDNNNYTKNDYIRISSLEDMELGNVYISIVLSGGNIAKEFERLFKFMVEFSEMYRH